MCAKLDVRVESPRGTARRSPRVSNNLAQLSSSMFNRMLDSFDEMTSAGKTNLVQGYASVMWQNNFLWNSALIDDQCYQDVRVVADIFVAISDVADIADIFGATSPFAPTLRTLVNAPKTKSEPSTPDDDGESSDAELSQAMELARLSALVPTLVTALA